MPQKSLALKADFHHHDACKPDDKEYDAERLEMVEKGDDRKYENHG